MGTMLSLGVTLAVSMLLIYPLFVWFDRVFAENYMRARRREWKIFAIQLSIVEGQMLTSINAMRKAMGEDPIESHILMDQFNTSEWRILSIESKKLAARAIEEIEGRHRVISS